MKQTSSDTTTHLPHNHQVLGVPALHTHPTGVARRGRGWGMTDSIHLMAACTHSDAVACTHMECIAGPWRPLARTLQGFSRLPHGTGLTRQTTCCSRQCTLGPGNHRTSPQSTAHSICEVYFHENACIGILSK